MMIALECARYLGGGAGGEKPWGLVSIRID